jgi:hypothetical protein
MANSSELEKLLQQKQADYTNAIKGGGSLVGQISDALNKAGGAETANLQKNLGTMLTNYVAAAPTARENYQTIFNPFVRDRLAAQSVQQQYAPIADIRAELSARAQALGIATRSAQSLYNTDLQAKQQDIGFTQDAYNRAFQKEQAAAARAASRASSSSRRSSSASAKAEDTFNQAFNYAQNLFNSNADKKTEDFWTENKALPDIVKKYGSKLDQDQINWILYEARKATWKN